MNKIKLINVCPCCQNSLNISQMKCASCDLTLSGNFEGNEFFNLSQEDMHFVRIFILCEGKIKEIEAALGISYPTVKNKLANIKTKLGMSNFEIPRIKTQNSDVLDELNSGNISFEDAMLKIKGVKK